MYRLLDSGPSGSQKSNLQCLNQWPYCANAKSTVNGHMPVVVTDHIACEPSKSMIFQKVQLKTLRLGDSTQAHAEHGMLPRYRLVAWPNVEPKLAFGHKQDFT